MKTPGRLKFIGWCTGALSALALAFSAHAQGELATASVSNPDNFVRVLQRSIERLNGAGMIYLIEANGQVSGGSVQAANGVTGFTDAPLRIASNTKTFVAVATLSLVEDGFLELDQAISETLPVAYTALLAEGGYSADAITLRMLLNHTSGIADHAQLTSYFEAIMADTDRVWTPEEQVALAMRDGQATGEPGERFAYSDTGYVLIGAILEQATVQPLATIVRERAIEASPGLLDTWWETLEPAPAGVAKRYEQQAFGGPLARIDASVDLYGGGGLISTVQDLLYFHRAAVRGELLDGPALNAAMLTPSPQSLDAGNGYGFGIFVRSFAGETCYEHSGFWGTLAVYCPESDIAFAAAVSDAELGFSALYPFVSEVVALHAD